MGVCVGYMGVEVIYRRGKSRNHFLGQEIVNKKEAGVQNATSAKYVKTIAKQPQKHILYNISEDNRSFREWVAAYTGDKSWLMFGIDLVFGKDADRIATKWETMFLPEVLSKELSEVLVVDNDSVTRTLFKSESIIVPKTHETEWVNYLKLPLVATTFILLVGLLLTIFEYKKKNISSVDVILYLFFFV